MILLDTNVISEPMRIAPDPAVARWINAQNIETLFLSAITLAELRFGVAALPTGKRRQRLHQDLERRLLPLFAGRILPFDASASQAHAELRAHARAFGQAIGASDEYIAGTAVAHGMALATRDIAPFAAAGLRVINPWQPAEPVAN